MLSLPLIIIVRLNSIKTWCKHLFLHQLIKWCHLNFLNLISLKRLQPNTHDCHTLKYIQILILYKKIKKTKIKQKFRIQIAGDFTGVRNYHRQ